MTKQIAIVAPSVSFEVKRSAEQIARDFIVSSEGGVKVREGAKITVEEIGFLIAEEWKGEQAKSVKQANLLRIARGLPAITVGEGEDAEEVPAFEFLKTALKNAAPTDGQFYNVFQLVDAIDFLEVNREKLGDKVNVFAVKNMMGPLRALEALPKPGEVPKLKGSKGKAIVDALKAGEPQAKLQEIANKLGAVRARKGKGKKGKTTPETPAAQDAPPVVTHTAQSVLTSIVSLRGQWEKAVQEGVKIDELRKLCTEELEKVVLLCGAAMVPLAGPEKQKPGK